MKKYTLLLGTIFVIGSFFFGLQQVKAIALYYVPVGLVNGKTATSSTAFIKGGLATTTVVSTSDGIEEISYYVTLTSSTTPPTLCWQNEYSNDGSFWYSEDAKFSSSTISIGGAVENCWVYASTTPTSATSSRMVTGADGKEIALFKRIDVKDLNAQFTRTLFYVRPNIDSRVGVERSFKNQVITTK